MKTEFSLNGVTFWKGENGAVYRCQLCQEIFVGIRDGNFAPFLLRHDGCRYGNLNVNSEDHDTTGLGRLIGFISKKTAEVRPAQI